MVTIAAGLLVLQAVLLIIGGIVAFLTADTLKEATDAYLEAQDASGGQTPELNPAFNLVFSIGLGIILLVLAWLVANGNNVGRIITWVVSGLGMFCCAGNVVSVAVGVDDYLSGGYVAYLYLSTLVQILAFLAVIVLLALPPAHPYFRSGASQPR